MILKGHKVTGGSAQGEAVVLESPFSFFGGVDTQTGELTAGPLAGTSIKGKVFVFPQGRGSTLAPYTAFATMANAAGPAAILCRQADGVVALLSIITRIPTLDRLEPDPIESIKNGDLVKVNADDGTVEVISK
ncbi:MAG: DUF126 domain-containing protein [Thermodesulfobacteriota bacterium]